MKVLRPLTLVAVLATMVMTLQGNGCFNGNDVAGINGGGAPQTGEGYCSATSNSYGHLFFCPTTRANLQQAGLPAGYQGYCVGAQANVGLVGYSWYTSDGRDWGYVDTQSATSFECNRLANCSGYIMCTRQ